MTDKPDQKTHEDPHSVFHQLASQDERVVALQIIEILKPFTPAERRQILIQALGKVDVGAALENEQG